MADAAKKDQESGEATDDQNRGKKKGLLKFILIPVIILVQAAAAYYVVFNVLLKPQDEIEEPKAPKENLTVGQFFEINDIVVNPAGSGGRRYIVIELAMETSDAKLLEEATGKEIWVRDAIISLLTSKTAEELIEPTARQKLKKQILGIINGKMLEGKFDRIYFKKYILQ